MKKIISLIIILVFAAGLQADEIVTISFEKNQLFGPDNVETNYSGLNLVSISEAGKISAREYLIELQPEEKLEALSWSLLEDEQLNWSSGKATADITTSADQRYNDVESIFSNGNSYSEAVFVNGDIIAQDRRYAELLIFPVSLKSDSPARLNKSIQIKIGERILKEADLINRSDIIEMISNNRNSANSVSSGGTTKFLIITSSELKPQFDRLAQFRIESGMQTKIVLIEQILLSYIGRDDAEKIREYFKEFYDEGGEYLLLGGDETVIPVRYAYHNNAYSEPVRERQQVCDLYYADLTGDWDVDGDNIWGEPYHDAPDIYPELIVGRLPFSNTAQVKTYIDKLILYETNPGYGDNEYLEKAFFFSADQMRDGNQHGLIAAAYPDNFMIDTVTGVESASGNDSSPTNLGPTELKEAMSGGFGIINILAHGRADGFVTKSSGYYDYPKNLLLTAEQHLSHGSFDSLFIEAKPSFYYSLACDNGGFEFDQPPINWQGVGMAEHLLSSKGGAIGFVANSRWGWVLSSHLMQTAFSDSLFAHPGRPAAEAMYDSKKKYYYIRDIVYGQNYLGDPTMVIYTKQPEETLIDSYISSDTVVIAVTADGVPASGVKVIITDSITVIAESITDENGQSTIVYPFNPTKAYNITVSGTNMLRAGARFVGSIVTAVDDDVEDMLPSTFSLSQNYPNPFNPTTTISFSLPYSNIVQIDLFNSLGQHVTTLTNREYSVGTHSVFWDGTNNGGEQVGSGIYYYRLKSDKFVETRKMVLLK